MLHYNQNTKFTEQEKYVTKLQENGKSKQKEKSDQRLNMKELWNMIKNQMVTARKKEETQ